MKSHIIGYSVVAVVALCVLSLVLVSMPAAQTQPAAAQGRAAAIAKAEAAPTPRLSDGHPDLGGYWAGGFAVENNAPHETTRAADGSIFFDYAGPNGGTEAAEDGYGTEKPTIRAPYKPEYRVKVQKIIDAQWGRTNVNDPDLDCKPAGVPRASFGGFVVASPRAVAIMFEASPGPIYRIVYTDGRQHPKDLDTSYMGHSIGHWEGDTLVVDTVALNDETWLGGAAASLHSDKEHVIERWTRKGSVVTAEATVEDPVMFTKPWVLAARSVTLAPPDPDVNYMQPQMCIGLDKTHFRTDDQYKCNWCAPESLYGGSSDQLSVAPENRLKNGAGPQ